MGVRKGSSPYQEGNQAEYPEPRASLFWGGMGVFGLFLRCYASHECIRGSNYGSDRALSLSCPIASKGLISSMSKAFGLCKSTLREGNSQAETKKRDEGIKPKAAG